MWRKSEDIEYIHDQINIELDKWFAGDIIGKAKQQLKDVLFYFYQLKIIPDETERQISEIDFKDEKSGKLHPNHC